MTSFVPLTDSVAIPQMGYGVFQIPDEDASDLVRVALRAGYRHVDTAMIYQNEVGVGKAIRRSDVEREDVFITTKVWNSDQGTNKTRKALAASLERLRMDYVDLYVIHWPVPSKDRYVDTWNTMRELRDEGKIRAIGVSNFEPEHLTRLYEETGEWPSLNQIELHPYFQQRELREFHAQHGIVTEAWSPLAHGKQVLQDSVLGHIAESHDATVAQVILAWHLAEGLVVLPKSATRSRIKENYAAHDLVLTEDDLTRIRHLDRGQRNGPNPKDFAVGA